MNENEIFEKLKEALGHKYLITDFGDKEVTNLEEYLESIRYERELEKYAEDDLRERHNTYTEFISYLHDKAIGDIKPLIECFDDNLYNKFLGYKEVTKEFIDGKLYICFECDETKIKAEWLASDNYAVWQKCGYSGDDYSGYLLFPTHKDNEYFVLWFNC